MKHLGDITKINGEEIPIVDCITGGSPCQDLSVAGKRAGLSGERSGLFMEQLRIVKEMRKRDQEENGRTNQFIRPRFMVWENVPGAFSSNNGKDFQAVLTEIVRIVEPDAPDVPMPDKGKWTKAGCIYDEMGRWSVAWRLHDAQFWGVPQRRKRIALVADFGGLAAPEVQFERKGVSRDTEPGGETRKRTAEDTQKSVDRTSSYSLQVGGVTSQNSQGMGYDEDVSFTLNAIDRHGVAYGISAYESNAMKSSNPHSGVYEADTARTLDLNGGSPACNQGGMAVVQSHVGINGSIAGTLDANYYKGCRERQGVEREVVLGGTYQKVVGTVDCGIAKGTGNQLADQDMFVANGSTVRRLTPLECERLQGFPDGWTDIGEWTDSKGKKRETVDSARYKALGNSIALPFWFYLLRRISATYERPATLGSLFDGIGGFPLCWERCNGEGTAIWASEIEEFPIAVTKRHFPERGDAE